MRDQQQYIPATKDLFLKGMLSDFAKETPPGLERNPFVKEQVCTIIEEKL